MANVFEIEQSIRRKIELIDSRDNKTGFGLYRKLQGGSASVKEVSVDEQRILDLQDIIQKHIGFWRKYPDLFLDFLKPVDSTFNIFFFQRIFLRATFRYQFTYFTFTRGFSKSFLSVMSLYLKCVLYPNIKVFTCTAGKEQASNIAKEKIEELWDFIPQLKNEIAKEHFGKDYVRLDFKNGSRFDVLQVQNTSRGARRHCGLIEEVILVDGDKLNEIIIPTMNINRRCRNGLIDPEEIHKSQIYVTTAGFKDTFAYNKLIQLMAWQVTQGNAFCMIGDYRIPMMYDLIDQETIDNLKNDGTYNEESIAREYNSIWSGMIEGAYYSSEVFDKSRILQKAETGYVPAKKGKESSFYIVSVDVGRLVAQTVATVIKVTKMGNKYYKSLVNVFVYEGKHFETQALQIKKLIDEFNAEKLVIDANGLGRGLVDFLMIDSIDPKTGQLYPPYSVCNDHNYDNAKREDSIPMIHNFVASEQDNSNMHINLLSQLQSGNLMLLQDEKSAKARLQETKEGREMSSKRRAEYLRPYNLTSILKTEMLNLKSKIEGRYLRLDRVNKKIGKDKFSAIEMGLYYIKQNYDDTLNAQKKKKSKFSNAMFFSKGSF